jgi:hypothetical protein
VYRDAWRLSDKDMNGVASVGLSTRQDTKVLDDVERNAYLFSHFSPDRDLWIFSSFHHAAGKRPVMTTVGIPYQQQALFMHKQTECSPHLGAQEKPIAA